VLITGLVDTHDGGDSLDAAIESGIRFEPGTLARAAVALHPQ
jgi:hypothetical protein